jgi:hypothetical protein
LEEEERCGADFILSAFSANVKELSFNMSFAVSPDVNWGFVF